MGHRNTKHPKVYQTVNPRSVNQNLPDQQDKEYSHEEYDLLAIKNLREELKEDPNTFILNMLLMSFAFFENFQEEMGHLAVARDKRIQNLDSQLTESQQKHLLAPDVVMKRVNSRIKFKSPVNGNLEPFIPQRLFIIHDNIKVVSESDDNVDDKNDKLLYRTQTEEWSNTEPCFVQVRLLTNSITENRRSSENSDESVMLQVHTTGGLKNDSGVSTTFNSDSESGCSKIPEASTSKKLEISENKIYTHLNQLPSTCISPIQVANMSAINEDFYTEDEDDDTNNDKRHLPELLITRCYLNSNNFMIYFKNTIFPHCIAEVLDFSENSVSNATSVPGSIFCDRRDSHNRQRSYEIIPAVTIPWPEKLAFEWQLRKRKVIVDKYAQIEYKWPTNNMIDEIQASDAVIIPRGFVPKRGENMLSNMEWEINFPKAEQHLELTMTHPQMRLYLFLITLFKTFIEPVTARRGLLVEHIRILMFWECQNNYILWPEDQLGTKLKLVLEKLYTSLGEESLSHYFVRSRNVFRNIPSSCLIYAQTVIHEILESPALYMLLALKHLNFVSEKWYPVPNLDELYKIITSDFAFDRKQGNPQKFTKKNQHEDVEQKWNRMFLEQAELKRKSLSVPKNPIQEEETVINLEIPLKEFDLLRSALLLVYFIEHFLNIAKHSYKINWISQSLFYLKQAFYLTKLLETSDVESAKGFQEAIRVHEKEISSGKEISEVSTPSVSKKTLYDIQEKNRTSNTGNVTVHVTENRFREPRKPVQPTENRLKVSSTNHFGTRRKQNAKLFRSHNNLEGISVVDKNKDRISKTGNRRIQKSVSFIS